MPMSVKRTICSTTKIDVSNQRYNYHILKSFCFFKCFFYVECLKSNLSTWQCTAIFRGVYSFIIPQRGGGIKGSSGKGRKSKSEKQGQGRKLQGKGKAKKKGKGKGKGKQKERIRGKGRKRTRK